MVQYENTLFHCIFSVAKHETPYHKYLFITFKKWHFQGTMVKF